MAINDDKPTVKTATQARAGERGLSVLAVTAGSTGLAIVLMALIWFIFFRT